MGEELAEGFIRLALSVGACVLIGWSLGWQAALGMWLLACCVVSAIKGE